MNLRQIHHGISCTDIVQTKRALRAIGFSQYQPGAPEPLVFRNQEDDFIGQVTAPVLGDEYHTHYVENPDTGQQIDLIEIQPAGLKPRDWSHPAQGDLIIGIQVPDPAAAYSAMQSADPSCSYCPPEPWDDNGAIVFDWRDRQRSVLTSDEPFAILHYTPEFFESAQRFFEEVLEVPVTQIDAQSYRLEGIKGRLEIRLTSKAKVLDFSQWGKRYPGANHFRLIERSIAGISQGIERTGLGGFIIPPQNGFAFLHGPCGEAIETFDLDFPSTA
ncbi:MAG: hypothetical protein ACR2PZ_15485 [Pseudomonadales bacterium]